MNLKGSHVYGATNSSGRAPTQKQSMASDFGTISVKMKVLYEWAIHYNLKEFYP